MGTRGIVLLEPVIVPVWLEISMLTVWIPFLLLKREAR